MKTKYANESFEQLGVGDTTTCVYQSTYYENDSVDTEIIQYFIMHGLGIFIKMDSCVAHMLYTHSFSDNTSVPITKKKNKYFIP